MLLWWPNGRGTPPELEPQQHLLRKTSHSLATATFCNISTLSASKPPSLQATKPSSLQASAGPAARAKP